MKKFHIILGSLIALLMLIVTLPVVADSLGSSNPSKAMPDRAKLGPVPVPSCATAADCTPETDLAIYKWLDSGAPAPGEEIVYYIELEHYGTSNATARDVVITDTLPANVTYVSDYNWSGFTTVITGSTVVWTRPALNPGEYVGVYLRVRVANTAQPDETLVNTVQVATSDPETDYVNNTYVDNTTVVPAEADMYVYKYGPTQAPQGDEMTYQIDFGNASDVAATGVVITDTLSMGMSLVAWSSDSYVDVPDHSLLGRMVTPTVVGNQVIWNVGTVEGQQSGSIYAVVYVPGTVPISDPVTNMVEISTDTPETVLGDNVSTAMATVYAPTWDLEVYKTWYSGNPLPGGEIKYKIDLYHSGGSNAPARDVVVTDTLPPDTTFVSWGNTSSGYSHDILGREITATVVGNQVVWRVGTVRPDQSVTIYPLLSIAETVPRGTVFTNTVQVATTDPDSIPDNDTSSAGVFPTWDMRIQKTVYSVEGAPAGQVWYRIGFVNDGNATAGDVVITDTLPPDTSMVSWSFNNYYDTHEFDGREIVADANGNQVVWNLGDVEANWYNNIYLTVYIADTVGVGTVLTNTAEVATSDVDVDPSDNYAEYGTTVVSPWWDIGIAYKSNADDPTVGNEFRYNVTFRSYGNMPASNVVLTDTLPANVSFVEVRSVGSGTGCGTDIQDRLWSPMVLGNQVVWQVGTVPAWCSYLNVGFAVKVADTVEVRDALCNLAQISTDNTDEVPGNDIYTHTVTVHAPVVDMFVEKSLTSAPGTPGGTMEYSIEFRNDGNATAQDVVITDILPPGFTLESWYGHLYDPYEYLTMTPTVGGGQVVWDIGSIEAGRYGYLYVTVRIPGALNVGDRVTNTVQVTTSSEDWDVTDNTSSLVTTLAPPRTDLYVYKRVSEMCSVAPGGEATYEIYFSNEGNWAASDVLITDTLPPGTTYVADYNSYGFTTVVTGSQVVWTSPGVEAGAYGHLYLRVQIPGAAQVGDALRNKVWITSSNTDDDLSNNVYTDTKTTLVTPTLEVSAYKYLDSYSHNDPRPGELITYTIYFYNDGNWTASGMTVTDTLPAGVSYVSSYGYLRTGSGSYVPLDDASVIGNQLVWQVSSVPGCGYGYAYVTVRIAPTMEAGDELINVVEVRGTAIGFEASTAVYTHTTVIQPPPCVELTDVDIVGPRAGYVNTPYVFVADETPSNATEPIVYSWSSSPPGTLVLPGEQEVTYAWGTTGTKTVSVIAQNCGGVTVQDDHTIALVAVRPVSITVGPGTGGILTFVDPQGLTTTVEIPAGAVSDTTTIIFTPVPLPTEPISAGLRFGNHAFDLDAYRNDQRIPDFTFFGTVTLTIRYSDEDVVGIDESDLALYRYRLLRWVKIGEGLPLGEGQMLYMDENLLEAWLRGFSRFGTMGAEATPSPIFVPLVMRNY